MPASTADPAASRSGRGGRGSSPDSVRSWSETYAATPYRDLPWFSPDPSPAVARAFSDGWLRAPGPSLDLGCGAGSTVLWLASKGFRATGVDLAPAAIAAAERRARRRKGRARFQVGDVLALPFSEGAFRVLSDIGCFHTLPLDRRGDYAREVARVLRPEGRFILSWVGRETTREMGPPHRPSLHEVTQVLEGDFLFARTEFLPAKKGGLAIYVARLVRRSAPQPLPR
jgi:SAM-dependent methyltransferase